MVHKNCILNDDDKLVLFKIDSTVSTNALITHLINTIPKVNLMVEVRTLRAVRARGTTCDIFFLFEWKPLQTKLYSTAPKSPKSLAHIWSLLCLTIYSN